MKLFVRSVAQDPTDSGGRTVIGTFDFQRASNEFGNDCVEDAKIEMPDQTLLIIYASHTPVNGAMTLIVRAQHEAKTFVLLAIVYELGGIPTVCSFRLPSGLYAEVGVA